MFFGSILRRISNLMAYHAAAPLAADFATLTGSAALVRMTKVSLRWADWERYSARQRSVMPMGGLVGSFHIEGHPLEQLWPYLWVGQWTHAGKATMFGNGAYRLVPLQCGKLADADA